MADSRLIRKGILTSEAVNQLGWPEEVFYRRLMSVADDFGYYDGRDSVLRAQLYPLKLDVVRESDVGTWKRRCAEAGLVRLYTVDNREYIQIVKFQQRLYKSSRPKWPVPPLAADCGNPPQLPAGCGDSPLSRDGVESESERESGDTPPLPTAPLPDDRFHPNATHEILQHFPWKRKLFGGVSAVEDSLLELRREGKSCNEAVEFLTKRVQAFAASPEGKTYDKEARWWFHDRRWREPDEAWQTVKAKAPDEKKRPHGPPGFEAKSAAEVASIMESMRGGGQ